MRYRPLGLVFLLAVLQIATAHAAWISLGGPEGSRPAVEILESSPDRIVIDYSIPGFDARPVPIDGRNYFAISLPGESRILSAGAPEVPHICRSVIIPDRDRMRARLIDAEFREIDGLTIVPSKGNLKRSTDPASVPFSFGPMYAGNDFYPPETVRLSRPYILRDYRGVAVEIIPFQARADGRLRVARHLRIEIVPDGPDRVNVIDRAGPPSRIVSEFSTIYERHFINWRSTDYVPVLERGSMVVITDDPFHDAMVPFVEWKNQEGIPTQLVDVTTIGISATLIKAYIRSLYESEGLAFVLLVGDNAQIAVPHAAGGASDATYSLVAGDDSYPDLFVGRFSAETIDQVATQVARSVGYEKAPRPGADWYGAGAGIASDQGPGDKGEHDDQHMETIRQKLLGFTFRSVDQIYDPGATTEMVMDALNFGRSLVNYCGHGWVNGWDTGLFSSDEVAALTNDWMLPFIFSVACFNGQFENGTCFAEAWMRSTQGGSVTGAIATYMSSIDQLWSPPMAAQDEAVDLLVGGRMKSVGGLCYNGSCRMMDEYGTDGVDTFLTWILFGDPSLMLRTDTPEAMTVTHAGFICSTQTEYLVDVPGVPQALCSLYGDGVLYGSAYADSAGAAVIQMNVPPQVRTLTLTVTAANRIPYFGAVNVPPVLKAPADGSTCNPVMGPLVWDPTPGAVGYRLQLGAGCGSDLIVDADVAPPPYEYGPLDFGTAVQWRVAPKFACGECGPFSACFTFTTEPQIPASPPILLSPSNGAQDQPTAGILDWEDVGAGVTGYRVQISTACGDGPESEVESSSFEYSDLLEDTVYSWRVRARFDCAQWGPYSDCFTFRTTGRSGVTVPEGEAPPQVVTLIAPAPNPSAGPTKFRYGLPLGGAVRLSLYDVSGREVVTLAGGDRPAGWHLCLWNGRDRNGRPLPRGVYIVRLVRQGRTRTERLIRIP